jgi:hypothetical protein
MSTQLLDKIKSRGYWHVLIRPTRFSEERIRALHDCQQLVEQYRVRHYGRYFPYLDFQALRRELDHIEHGVTLGFINEVWRFYQSGQFVFFSGLEEDWLKESPRLPARSSPSREPGSVLDILGILYRLSEVYEFATRLAQQGIFGDSLLLKVSMVGMSDRLLGSWDARQFIAWGLERDYKCHTSELPREKSFPVRDFIARSQEYSFEHFSWVMDRFGFVPSEAIFKCEQERFFAGRL